MGGDPAALAAVGATRLFSDLDESQAQMVAARLRPFSAVENATLFRAGAPVEHLLVLCAGTVGIGDPVLGTAGPGDVLGELALNGPTTHTAAATALEPVDGFLLETGDFDQLRAGGDPVAFALLRRLSRVLATRIRGATDGNGRNRTPLRPAATPGPSALDELPFLRALSYFQKLELGDLRGLAASLRTWRLERGATLFGEGATARSAFVVVRGAIEVSRKRGNRHVRLATLGPGRMVGELSLIDGGSRTATCTALEPTVALEIDADVVANLLDDHSLAGLDFLQAVNGALIAALRATDARRSRFGFDWAAASAGAVDHERERLIEKIRTSVIGEDAVFEGPFGPRRLVYADYTASGRALTFIEDFIRDDVLPLYANTHTESSAAGLQTTRLREDARRLIHRAVGGSDEDVVLFCGTGATGAIAKLVQILGLRTPSVLEDEFHLSDAIAADRRPVVFVGPYEHHSNELPWRESIADVVPILEDADGLVDLAHLEHELRRYAHRPLKIGTFSAASNVTGITTDVERVAIVLHRYGAFSCWDYAAAGPYVPIDMNACPEIPDGHLAYKDAVFLSPHKFIGGPATPGVLVAKRSLFRNRVPSEPGGGTVVFVNPSEHQYFDEPTVREEGGTPAIIGSIRAGLVFALKEAVGAAEIERREHDFVRRALRSWGANPQIEILGNPELERLAIVSFAVRHGTGLLHSHYVTALLNDLFGIQARSGCFCAGPYLHRMYEIDEAWSDGMQAEASRGHLGARLAFVRVNFNYFTSEATFDYIVEAVDLVANEGWKLLPLYQFDPFTGLWHHESGRPRPALTLHDVSFASGTLEFDGPRAREPESALSGYLDEGRRIIRAVEAEPPRGPAHEPMLTSEFERIRWFPLPGEALAQLARRPSA
jgi:selenocysteine lyase/cysteine desulfurase/CRP-like cAMP-binding protein